MPTSDTHVGLIKLIWADKRSIQLCNTVHSMDVMRFWSILFDRTLIVDSLLRRGLHEVSSEGKVSAQGEMGRAK